MSVVPRVSIGLPVYNGEDYLAESLEALLGQSYEDFELIISDNASTDGTAEICRRYAEQDSRIRYIRQPRNIGAAPNHNFVFESPAASCSSGRRPTTCTPATCSSAAWTRSTSTRTWCWPTPGPAAVDGRATSPRPWSTRWPRIPAQAPERFRSMLFGSGEDDFGLIRADDQYGVIRSEVLRRVAPQDSYYHSDRTFMAEIALHGPFHQTPRTGCTSGGTTPTGPSMPTHRPRLVRQPGPAPARTGCGTRPSACTPSTSGGTPRRSGARRCRPRTGVSATAAWPSGPRAGSRSCGPGSARAPGGGGAGRPRC